MAGKTIRELLVSLKVDSQGGMDRLAKFGLAVNGAKAGLDLLVGSFRAASKATFGFIDEQTKQADGIAKGARAAALSSREFQRLNYAMERSGVPFRNFNKATQNLARNMRDAALGEGEQFKLALKEIGLSMNDLIGLPFEEKLGLIGESLQSLPTKAERMAAASKILGEMAGPKMATLLLEGRAGLKALGDEAERLGFVLSDKSLKAAEDYQDSLTRLSSIFSGIKRVIATEAAPQFKAIVDRTGDFIKGNKAFIQVKIGKVISEIGRIIGDVVSEADKWIESFKDIVDLSVGLVRMAMKIIESFGGVETVMKLATAAFLAFGAAQVAALGPVGWAVGLAIAIGNIAGAFDDVADSATRAKEKVSEFGSTKVERSASEGEIKSLAYLLSDASKSGRFGLNTQSLIRAIAQLTSGDIERVFKNANRPFLETANPLTSKERLEELKEMRRNLFALQELIKEERRSIAQNERFSDIEKRRAEALRSVTGIDPDGGPSGEQAAFNRLKRLGENEKPLSQDELLKLIDAAADDGKSLTGLIGNRKIEGGAPPVISIRHYQNTFSTVVNGADSRTVEQLAGLIEEAQQKMLREATDVVGPVFVR